jgi:hypothetical protein
VTTVDDLRLSLARHALDAPPADGILAAATSGAARIRRRRRITTAAVAAAVAGIVAVGVPLAVTMRRPGSAAPIHGPLARGAGEMTLDLDPTAGFPIVQRVATGTAQRLTVLIRGSDPAVVFQGTLETADPAPDTWAASGRLDGGESATGRGLSVPFSGAGSRPVLQWRDPSGLELRATQTGGALDRARLTAFADAARVGPPRALETPFQLGPLPDGVKLNSVDVQQDFMNNGAYTSVWLSAPAAPAGAYEIRAFPKGPDWPTRDVSLTPTEPVAGHTAYDDPYDGNQRVLTVDAGSCWVQFIKVPSMTTAEQRALAAATTYGDCAGPASIGEGKPDGPALRSAGQMTLDLAADSGFTVTTRGAGGSAQILLVTGPAGFAGSVHAYDPGTSVGPTIPPDITRESIIVHGRTAILANRTLFWQEPGGVWLQVEQASATYDLATLTKLAAAVRFATARTLTAPVTLTPLPDGLRLTGVTITTADRSTVALTYPDTGPAQRRQIDIVVEPRAGRRPAGLDSVDPVGGHPAYFGPAGGGRSELWVEYAGCQADFVSDPAMSEPAIRALAAAAVLRPCRDHTSWRAPA